MPRTSPYHIELSDDESDRLEASARRYSSPQRDVVRAKIVLLAPVRLIGVDTTETVDPEQLIGCNGPQASGCTEQILADRLVRLKIPRIGDSEDAYGRTLAYVYLDTNGDGRYEHSFNEDLIELGLARTTDFSHEHRREFERLREQAEERGAGLWGACSKVESY